MAADNDQREPQKPEAGGIVASKIKHLSVVCDFEQIGSMGINFGIIGIRSFDPSAFAKGGRFVFSADYAGATLPKGDGLTKLSNGTNHYPPNAEGA